MTMTSPQDSAWQENSYLMSNAEKGLSNENQAGAYGVYPQDVRLEEVVGTLNDAGFRSEDLCVVLAPTHPIASIVRDAGLLTSEPGSDLAAVGMLAWLTKFGAVIIPNIGFFVGAGMFLHALVAADDRVTPCDQVGVLFGLGIPEAEAIRFGRRLSEDGVLIYVSSDQPARSEWAREVMRRTGAEEAAALEPGSAVESD